MNHCLTLPRAPALLRNPSAGLSQSRLGPPLFAAVIWRWRFVSLGSVVVVVLAPLVAGLLSLAGQGSQGAVALAAGGAAVVTLAHRDNIVRLRAGTERRLGR